jgi:histidinol-phosphate aminotransferase
MSPDVKIPRPPLGQLRTQLETLRAYSAPEERPAIRLDANEAPYPLPAEWQRRVAEELATADLHRYPDPRAHAVRSVLADRLQCRKDELILGVGSDELIALLTTALAGAGRATVLYPTPTFAMYRVTSLAHGLEPVGIPLSEGWQLDVEAMLEAVDRHRPSLVFLATPNNPTGNRFDDADLTQLIESAPETVFVVDEAYGAFSGQPLGRWCDVYANVVCLGTLSKVGLAAARFGWARLHPELAVEVDKVRQPYNLSVPTQILARLGMTELAPVLDEQVMSIVRERQRVAETLGQLDVVTVYPSDANFLLVRFDRNADAVADALRDAGIAIRSFESHGGVLAKHARITVGTPEENDRLVAELTTHLS